MDSFLRCFWDLNSVTEQLQTDAKTIVDAQTMFDVVAAKWLKTRERLCLNSSLVTSPSLASSKDDIYDRNALETSCWWTLYNEHEPVWGGIGYTKCARAVFPKFFACSLQPGGRLIAVEIFWLTSHLTGVKQLQAAFLQRGLLGVIAACQGYQRV